MTALWKLLPTSIYGRLIAGGTVLTAGLRAVEVVEDGGRRTAEGVEVVGQARDSFLRLAAPSTRWRP